MSDQQQPEKKKQQKSNPLEGLGGSSLFASSTPTALPQLPSIPTQQPVQEPPQPEPSISSPQPQETVLPQPKQSEQPPMLWNTPASPELILRDFVQRHDKQAIYMDVRYAGAIAALAKLVHKGNKTDLINEMIEDLLEKYSQLLNDNEALVRILEDKVREKHHID